MLEHALRDYVDTIISKVLKYGRYLKDALSPFYLRAFSSVVLLPVVDGERIEMF